MTKCWPDLPLQLFKKKLFRSELDHKFGFTPFYGTMSLFCSDHYGAPVLRAGVGGGEKEIIYTLQVDSVGPDIFLRSDSAGYY